MVNSETIILKNGLKVLYEHHPTAVVSHVAVMVKAGTRDEGKNEEGLAHYIEHCLFKGTKNRKSYHILNRLEVIGGDLNAYTTKEETCLHASVMNQYLPRAVELIADIFHNSIFPEKEIEKEKDVIIDEIHSYQDTPYEQIFDDFEGQVFKGHTLGHPILGTEKSLRSFKRKSIVDFIKRNYHPSVTVFSVSGSIGLEKAIALAEEFFGMKKSTTSIPKRTAFKKHQSSEVEVPKAISQVHYISGIPAYALNDPRRYTLVLLNNLLGGPGMNSRLNLNVREKYGFTYTIESGYHTYSDTGIFFLYFATDKKHFNKTLKLANQELDKLCDKTLGDKLFMQYREQLLGQIMMAQENRLSVLLSRSKAFLNFGSVISVDEIRAKVKSVSAKDIQTAAKELLGNKDRSALIYKPA